jgi:hypothetical protein
VHVEDLAVSGLGRTRLAASVHDAGWSAFVGMLEYVAALHGRTFTKVDRAFPSSQVCSVCEVGVVDLIEQGREGGISLVFAPISREARMMQLPCADGGQHEDLAAVRSACAAEALAVHRDRPAPGTHRLGSGGGPVTPALFALGSAVGHERSGRREGTDSRGRRWS